MARMKLIQNLPIGSSNFEGFCIVKSATVRQNSKGADYLDLVVGDCEGEAPAKVWDYTRSAHGEYNPGDVIKVRGSIVLYKDAEQLKVEKIRHMKDDDPVDMNDLVLCAPIPSDKLYDDLYKEAESFQDYDLKRLVQYLLKENKEQLLYFPAAVKLHHATRGGLLHHSWSLLQLAKSVCKQYPKLNSDLLYAGCILHDIGKLKEFETSELGIASAYSEPGQLLGHINIGVTMVAETATLLDIPQETVLLVEHMILSHHGEPEFGSSKYPMFPEAEVLSTLDLLDSKLYEMFATLDAVQPGCFSERQWALDNRQLYRHCFGEKKED